MVISGRSHGTHSVEMYVFFVFCFFVRHSTSVLLTSRDVPDTDGSDNTLLPSRLPPPEWKNDTERAIRLDKWPKDKSGNQPFLTLIRSPLTVIHDRSESSSHPPSDATA